MGRPFLLLDRQGAGAHVDQYLASNATSCLDVLAAQFKSVFPEWARDVGPPKAWPESSWHHELAYPLEVTAGLDHFRDLWLARQRGEETFVLPINQTSKEEEEPRTDDIADFLDSHALAVLSGYAVAGSSTVRAGSGWVNPRAMLDHVQLPSPLFRSARDVFGPTLPTGLLKPDAQAHYNKGRLTDDTGGVLGAVVATASSRLLISIREISFTGRLSSKADACLL